MTITKFEETSIENAYSIGAISYEDYCRLLNDITPLLWDEMVPELDFIMCKNRLGS